MTQHSALSNKEAAYYCNKTQSERLYMKMTFSQPSTDKNISMLETNTPYTTRTSR